MPQPPVIGQRWAWLPAPGTWRYYALLASIGILLLGPLGGVAAAYMNFSLGFFVGGQTLAGILGSLVTVGYGSAGKHGANYMQTTAASVAGMAGLAVTVQAFAWLGLPQPPAWHLVAYLTCIGMFGVGVGMLYTPLLVDRMRLTFPSGLAVANILRALTDPLLLRRSVATLGGGIAAGIACGVATARVAWLGAIEFSAATFGAGMIVGARIGLAALTGGAASWAAAPYFVSIGWLEPTDPARKITFLIALGMILGAAVLDVSTILLQAWLRLRAPPRPAAAPLAAWRLVDTRRILAWIAVWGVAVLATGTGFFDAPLPYLLFALALVFVFALVNGIAMGISDSNPISSAFVVTVVLLAALGLREPAVGMIVAAVLLVSTSVACDMQQDRSTGARLGTDRRIQFRFQAGGVLAGALLAVFLAQFFMAAYPVLRLDQTVLPADQQPAEWASAMTYKFVGALRGVTEDKPYQRTAIWIGVGIGLATAVARLLLKESAAYKRFAAGSRTGAATDFLVDSVLLPSPYASSFGGFVSVPTVAWFAAGGVAASAAEAFAARRRRAAPSDLPEDMSATSLVGGGLLAGDALAALGIGAAGLARAMAGR
ncbi:MAG: OPT/YSL family transporter [Alphaproteobacteria bacterium]|nr:OPT/YSL family transporter [Alphaproteobacteria bacterium]